MDTKKCPRCGEEIPSEMQFCLHCMERTDGVLEIRQKSRSRSLIYLLAGIAILLLVGITLLLIFLLRSDEQKETNLSLNPPETIATTITPSITETDTTKPSLTDAETAQETAAIQSDTPDNAVITTDAPQENANAIQTGVLTEPIITNTAPIQTQPPIASETAVQTTAQAVTVPPAPIVTEPPATQTPIISFAQRITDGLAGWGGSNVDASTLVFSGNNCTFTANASGSPLSCTLESNAECTAFTLVMAQSSPYAAYSPGTYVPDLTNTFSSILLEYSPSSGLRGEIRTMLNNFGTQQVFTENGYSYTVTAEKQNDGTKTVTVTASIS